MRLKVSIPGFKLLRPVAKKTSCRVRIVKKRGIPFVLNRYKRRKAFVAGAVVFMGLVYTLTSFIWAIEISGNEKVDKELLIQKLEDMGVKPGVVKFGVDTKRIASDLMIDFKELAWVGVVVKGTKLKLEVAERRQPPELVAKDVPCDIVASKPGIIKSVIAKAGQESVKPGDTVVKGQTLITGAVDTKNEEIKQRLVHAIGSVKARTWYEGKRIVETKVYDKERTGNQKEYYSLELITKRLGKKVENPPYENYERVEIKKKLSLGKDMELPFAFVIDRFYENNIVEREISLDEAKQSAMDDAYKTATENIPQDAEIVNSDLNFVQDENGNMYASVVVECIEDIGVTKEIGGK